MKIGNLESPVTIDGTQKVIYDSGELTAAATSITISGLDGDVDEEYELIVRTVNGSGGNTYYGVRINNDSTANIYGAQNLDAIDTNASAQRFTTTMLQFVLNPVANTHQALVNLKLKAKTGQVRTAIVKYAQGISGTTVTRAGLFGYSYNETATNITSLVVLAVNADGLGIGSRVILLKKVNATDGIKTGNLEVQGKIYGVWQEVYNSTLTEAATSVTISGLTGNTDVLYRVRARSVGGYNGASNIYIRINNDSSSIYGKQYLGGLLSTVYGGRSVIAGIVAGINTLNNLSLGECLIYAKSGFVRTAISSFSGRINTTTVNEIWLYGFSYNETSTEITSLVILAEYENGLGIGTNIIVEKLNLI